jgi:hypothetical protein
MVQVVSKRGFGIVRADLAALSNAASNIFGEEFQVRVAGSERDR